MAVPGPAINSALAGPEPPTRRHRHQLAVICTEYAPPRSQVAQLSLRSDKTNNVLAREGKRKEAPVPSPILFVRKISWPCPSFSPYYISQDDETSCPGTIDILNRERIAHSPRAMDHTQHVGIPYKNPRRTPATQADTSQAKRALTAWDRAAIEFQEMSKVGVFGVPTIYAIVIVMFAIVVGLATALFITGLWTDWFAEPRDDPGCRTTPDEESMRNREKAAGRAPAMSGGAGLAPVHHQFQR